MVSSPTGPKSSSLRSPTTTRVTSTSPCRVATAPHPESLWAPTEIPSAMAATSMARRGSSAAWQPWTGCGGGHDCAVFAGQGVASAMLFVRNDARHDPFFGRCRKCHECGDDARRQARADSPECIPSPWFDRLSISQILREVSVSGDVAARLRRHRLADAECRSLPQVCPARRWLDATADGRVGDRVKRGPQRSHCRLVRSRASRSSSRRMPARKC